MYHWWYLFLLDRFSKMFAVTYVHGSIKILPFLWIETLFNRGIALSLFHTDETTGFIIVSCAVMGMMVMLIKYIGVRRKTGYDTYAELLVFVGALSNLLDRFRYGAVVDFIRISWGTISFPVFNMADVYIVCGVFWMLYEHFVEQSSHHS